MDNLIAQRLLSTTRALGNLQAFNAERRLLYSAVGTSVAGAAFCHRAGKLTDRQMVNHSPRG
jgi:hypothetical protein